MCVSMCIPCIKKILLLFMCSIDGFSQIFKKKKKLCLMGSVVDYLDFLFYFLFAFFFWLQFIKYWKTFPNTKKKCENL
jgi:hypothetical protein